MADAEARWYVAHTYSGYENKVKMDIEKTIENRGLQDQILEVSVPMLNVRGGLCIGSLQCSTGCMEAYC